MDYRGHDGRLDPTGSGQNQGNDDLSFPLIKKRSKFRRVPPKRFVDTERDIESNRPTTQSTDERLQGASPSTSHSVHLPTLTGTAIAARSRDNSSPVRFTASSPNPIINQLILPPIEPVRRVPTPRPPQTPNNSNRQGNFRARFNHSDGSGPSTSGSRSTQAHPPAHPPTHPPQAHPINVLNLEFCPPSPDHNARTNSRTYTAFSREANSASRNANSASRNITSRLGGNASRISNLQGSTSAKSRDDAPSPSSMRTSSGQPVPPTSTYQHPGSSSDGALMIKGIKKPTAPLGNVCNSNTLRRHSTGGKMVPKHEKTNQGLMAIDEKPFLMPKPPDKPKGRPPSSRKRPSKPSLKSPRRSSNHPSKTSQADDNYEPDFHPESDEEAKTAINSSASSSKASSRTTSSKAASQPPSSNAASRPPSSIHEEIEGSGRYDYSDEVFETYEDPEAGSRSVSEVSSIPEELPGQSKPYNYQDDDVPLETDISEEIVTSDDHDDEDYTCPTSRC